MLASEHAIAWRKAEQLLANEGMDALNIRGETNAWGAHCAGLAALCNAVARGYEDAD